MAECVSDVHMCVSVNVDKSLFMLSILYIFISFIVAVLSERQVMLLNMNKNEQPFNSFFCFVNDKSVITTLRHRVVYIVKIFD